MRNGAESLSAKITIKAKPCPTQRALDAGESPRFLGIFSAFACFRLDGVPPSAPAQVTHIVGLLKEDSNKMNIEYQIIVLALGLFVLLSLIGFLLFKRKAKVGFTIAKWFKFDFEGSNESDSPLQVPVAKLERNEPILVLELIDCNGQHKHELTFVQVTNNQDFLFGIALINIAEGSMPAEKLDIHIEISWDGTDISKAPKFRATDTYGRAIPGWTAPRQQIQQSDIPLPARLSFHGTNDMRCPFGHPLEWYRFSVLLAGKCAGRFILDYTVSSASPVIENKGKCYIRISPT